MYIQSKLIKQKYMHFIGYKLHLNKTDFKEALGEHGACFQIIYFFLGESRETHIFEPL